MRFLVVTMSRQAAPPSPELMDAMLAWVRRHRESGRMEQVWNFAGVQGGGGILNVDSLEQLSEIMAEMPLAPFSNIQVYGLTDVEAAMERARKTMEQMPTM
jgi:muconolactone delta-isomerase